MAINKDFIMGYGAGKAAGGGGSGGNPNRVEVVEGTMGNIFDGMSVTFSELYYAISLYNATAYIEFEFQNISIQLPLSAEPSFVQLDMQASQLTTGTQFYQSAIAWWRRLSNLEQYDFATNFISSDQTGGQIINATSMFESIPATLTIIWHPLPD